MKTIIENLIVCLESVPVEVPGWGVRVQRIHEAREYLATRRDIFAEIGASEKNVQRDADPVTLPSGRKVYQGNLKNLLAQTSHKASNELYGADPSCNHEIVDAPGGGVKCRYCTGWFCY